MTYLIIFIFGLFNLPKTAAYIFIALFIQLVGKLKLLELKELKELTRTQTN